MLEMNLITILDSNWDRRVNLLKTDTELLLKEFNDLFEVLGKLDGQYRIVADQSIRPVMHPLRPLPVAIIKRVQRKLKEMAAVNTIQQVDQLINDWVSGMLVASKPSTEA